MSRQAAVDAADLLLPGPWQHRFVSANGCRFHVVEAGHGPPVMLLHDFPQLWWSWRHVIEGLAARGHRVLAMDLRGYAGSDKPPRGYDTGTSSSDVTGVLRALDAAPAVVAGLGWGGWLAWSLPSYAPTAVRAVAAIGAAHPLLTRRELISPRTTALSRRVRRYQVPIRPERALRDGGEVLATLRAWGGPGYPDEETARVATLAMRVPFAAHTSLEYWRWVVRSVGRRDGRLFATALREPVAVPVLAVRGELDPCVSDAGLAASRTATTGGFTRVRIPGVGHFLPEEAPGELTAALTRWIADLPS